MDRLLELAEKLVRATGYDEISLMSLSSGDYSCLPELAREMVRRFAAKRVKISLPSQRIDNVLTDTLKETQKVRKTAPVSYTHLTTCWRRDSRSITATSSNRGAAAAAMCASCACANAGRETCSTCF